jgi:hypothetical protein
VFHQHREAFLELFSFPAILKIPSLRYCASPGIGITFVWQTLHCDTRGAVLLPCFCVERKNEGHYRAGLMNIATKGHVHMKPVFLLTSLLCLLQLTSAMPSDLPAVRHYKLDVQLELKEQRVSVVATLSIKNATNTPQTKLPFLLYRLLTVQRVDDRNGAPLSFKQDIVQLHDEPSLQVKEAIVDLHSPLAPNDSVTVVLTYDGFIFGYPEVMAYVRDRIDESYSLLRPDAFAYPLLAEAIFSSVLAAYDTRFTYEITATVPKGYTAATGGELFNRQTNTSTSTFMFRSKIPTWRIDLAVARFSVLSDSLNRLFVYHLPGDSVGARRVIGASRDVINLYRNMFGTPKHYQGYTIIEIPDGWGSQAGDFYFLQTGAAFSDSARIGEVYHEIGHSWNAKASSEVQRCRYFDEAFASFFEPLAIRSFQGDRAFGEYMEKSRESFVRRANQDREVYDTPIAEYGKKELGRHSYTKGAWSLYVLYKLLGEKTFLSIIQKMLIEFDTRTINFSEFQSLCEDVSKRSLDKFFKEWIYGIESSRLMVEKVPISEITKRY